jgi:hypothetical protein
LGVSRSGQERVVFGNIKSLAFPAGFASEYTLYIYYNSSLSWRFSKAIERKSGSVKIPSVTLLSLTLQITVIG